jgi:hypothetical protein
MVDSVFRTRSTWFTPVNIQLLRMRSNKVSVQNPRSESQQGMTDG